MGSWETDLVAGTRTWTAKAWRCSESTCRTDAARSAATATSTCRRSIPKTGTWCRTSTRWRANAIPSRPNTGSCGPTAAVLWLAGRGLVVSRLADGHARALVSIMADVTERKHAEDELRVERERLDLALKAGQMGAFDLDMIEPASCGGPSRPTRSSASRRRTSCRRPQRVAALLHPDDREAFVQRRAEAIAQREPYADELRILRPDGSVAWIGYQGQCDYDAAQRPVRTFGIAVDITERKNVLQALHEADRKKDNFIATLAHELRNPLAPIRNSVHILSRLQGLSPQAAWCCDVIERQVGQMSHLLEDLLDIARIASGQFRLRREPLMLVAGLRARGRDRPAPHRRRRPRLRQSTCRPSRSPSRAT